MTIDGAASIIKLLQRRFIEEHGGLQDFTFKIFRTADLGSGLVNHVSLFLYRVDVDQTRRHVDRPPTELGRLSRFALGVELRYLLTVWGQTAEKEHEILGLCMEILDRHAILAGDLLDPSHTWDSDDELKICLESLTNEDMLRIWDGLEPAYQLSVPYLVRTLLLSPVERAEGALVESRTHVWTPRASL